MDKSEIIADITKKPTSIDHTKHEALLKDQKEFQQSLDNKRKELEENISPLYHSLKKLRATLSRMDKAQEESSKKIRKVEKDKKSANKSTERVKSLLSHLSDKQTAQIQLVWLKKQVAKTIITGDNALRGLVDQEMKYLETQLAFFKRNSSQIDQFRKTHTGLCKKLNEDKGVFKSKIDELSHHMGFELSIDVDSYFDANPSSEINDLSEYTREKVKIEKRGNIIYRSEFGTKTLGNISSASEEMASTNFHNQFLFFVVRKNIGKDVEKSLQDAIEGLKKPIHEQKRQNKTFTEHLKRLEESKRKSSVSAYSEENAFAQAMSEGGRLYQAMSQKNAATSETEKKREALKAETAGIRDSHKEKAIEYLTDAINAINMPAEEIKERNKLFNKEVLEYCHGCDLKIIDFPGIKEIKSLYKALLDEDQQHKKAIDALQTLETRLAEIEDKINQGQESVTTEDKAKFDEAVSSWVQAHIDAYKQFDDQIKALEAVIHYCDSINDRLKHSLEKSLAEHKEAISTMELDIATHKMLLSENAKQTMAIRAEISELEDTARITLNSLEQASRDQEDIDLLLAQQYQKLQEEVQETTRQLERIRMQLTGLRTSREVSTGQDTPTPPSLPPLEIALKRATAERQTLLEDPVIENYTNTVREIYYTKYGEEVDINQAIDSAQYLKDRNLVEDIAEKAIASATHLIKHFGATFDHIYINKKTHEIVIINTPASNRDPEFIKKVDIDENGRLIVDKKKQKGFVIASLKDKSDVLIVPIKEEVAYDSTAFAGGTPTLPGGTAGIEDFIKLKGGNMNVFAIGVEREFREETFAKGTGEGYQIVPGTLTPVKNLSRQQEDILFFEAEAELTTTMTNTKGSSAAIDTRGSSEMKGIVLLDIMDTIAEGQLSTYSPPALRRFKITKAIVDAAHRQRPDLIPNVPGNRQAFQDGPKGRAQWKQCLESYCTGQLADYIMEHIIPEFIRLRQGISYRVKGSDDWKKVDSVSSSQG